MRNCLSEIMGLFQDSVDDGAGMAMGEITSEVKGGDSRNG